jgi:hypothetical protein
MFEVNDDARLGVAWGVWAASLVSSTVEPRDSDAGLVVRISGSWTPLRGAGSVVAWAARPLFGYARGQLARRRSVEGPLRLVSWLARW